MPQVPSTVPSRHVWSWCPLSDEERDILIAVLVIGALCLLLG